MKAKNNVAIIILVTLMLTSGIISAFGGWYEDVSGGKYVPIEGENFEADSFCGVPALYNENGSNKTSDELIVRFYKQAYSLDVSTQSDGVKMLSKSCEFVTPSAPRKGDIIFSPSYLREGNGEHFAIVKSYSRGKITLFEQNVVKDGKAAVGRQLKFPGNSYFVYSPKAKSGYVSPTLVNVKTGEGVVKAYRYGDATLKLEIPTIPQFTQSESFTQEEANFSTIPGETAVFTTYEGTPIEEDTTALPTFTTNPNWAVQGSEEIATELLAPASPTSEKNSIFHFDEMKNELAVTPIFIMGGIVAVLLIGIIIIVHVLRKKK